MIRMANLYDNAMLYKDLTQWIRTKTFLTLFVGLLAFGEFIAVFFSSTIAEDEPTGQIAFGFLTGALMIFALIIGFNGMMHTGREFANRTFELYALSGMSLEKMVFGKFSSMMAQFFFGFFCLVPFMFFCYLLGGLDFYSVLGTTLMGGLAAAPLFLFFLMIALLRKGKGSGNVAARIIIVLIVLYMAPAMLSMIFMFTVLGASMGGPMGGGSVTASLITALLGFNAEVLLTVLAFLLLYTQGCLLLFYVCCHSLSPVCDSRETAIKGITTTLCLTWLGLMGGVIWNGAGDNQTIAFGILVTGIAVLCLGFFFFFTPLRVPRMALARQQSAGLAMRCIRWLFLPGPGGTIRTILFLLIAICGFTYGTLNLNLPGTPIKQYASKAHEVVNLFSLAIQVPFFLVFPIGLLLNFRRVATRLGGLRIGLLVWWLLAAALLIAFNALAEYYRHKDELLILSEFAALIVSPFSSATIGWTGASEYHDSAATVRIVLGIVGLFLMFSVVRRRARIEARFAGLAASRPSPAPTGGDGVQCETSIARTEVASGDGLIVAEADPTLAGPDH